jgi:hypothetical protein
MSEIWKVPSMLFKNEGCMNENHMALPSIHLHDPHKLPYPSAIVPQTLREIHLIMGYHCLSFPVPLHKALIKLGVGCSLGK